MHTTVHFFFGDQMRVIAVLSGSVGEQWCASLRFLLPDCTTTRVVLHSLTACPKELFSSPEINIRFREYLSWQLSLPGISLTVSRKPGKSVLQLDELAR